MVGDERWDGRLAHETGGLDSRKRTFLVMTKLVPGSKCLVSKQIELGEKRREIVPMAKAEVMASARPMYLLGESVSIAEAHSTANHMLESQRTCLPAFCIM